MALGPAGDGDALGLLLDVTEFRAAARPRHEQADEQDQTRSRAARHKEDATGLERLLVAARVSSLGAVPETGTAADNGNDQGRDDNRGSNCNVSAVHD